MINIFFVSVESIMVMGAIMCPSPVISQTLVIFVPGHSHVLLDDNEHF